MWNAESTELQRSTSKHTDKMQRFSYDWPTLFEMLAPKLLAIINVLDFINLFCVIGRFNEIVQKLLLDNKVKIASKLEWYIFKRRYSLRYVYNSDELSHLPLVKKRIILTQCDHLTLEDYEALFNCTVNEDSDVDYKCVNGIDLTDIRNCMLAREDVPFEIVQRVFNSYEDNATEKKLLRLNVKNKNLMDPADDRRLAAEVFNFFDTHLPFTLYSAMKPEQFDQLLKKLRSTNTTRPFCDYERNYYLRNSANIDFISEYFNFYCDDRTSIENYLAGVYTHNNESCPLIVSNTRIPFDIVKRCWTEKMTYKNVLFKDVCNQFTSLFNKCWSFYLCYLKTLEHIDECMLAKVNREDIAYLFQNRHFIKAFAENKLTGFAYVHKLINADILFNIGMFDMEVPTNFYYNVITSVLKYDNTSTARMERSLLQFLQTRLKDKKILTEMESCELVSVHGNLRLPFLCDISVYPKFHQTTDEIIRMQKIFQPEQCYLSGLHIVELTHASLKLAVDSNPDRMFDILTKEISCLRGNTTLTYSHLIQIMLQYFPGKFTPPADGYVVSPMYFCQIRQANGVNYENIFEHIYLCCNKSLAAMVEHGLLIQDVITGQTKFKNSELMRTAMKNNYSFWIFSMKTIKWDWPTLYAMMKNTFLNPLFWYSDSASTNCLQFFTKFDGDVDMSIICDNGMYSMEEIVTIFDIIRFFVLYDSHMYNSEGNDSLDRMYIEYKAKNKRLQEFVRTELVIKKTSPADIDFSKFDIYKSEPADFII